jgi:iron complex outermembrane receptor protein
MKWLVISLLTLSFFTAQCQNVFSGKITDAETHLPVGNAFVSISELHVSTVSGDAGDFQFKSLSSGKFLLQISHLGYQDKIISINIPSSTITNIELTPSWIDINEIVFTGSQVKSSDETSYNISQLSLAEAQQTGAVNLSDAITGLPGISQLTTGIGISKPVIRGLYGNRIQVNVDGIRFDNQQWQDEHGLGLSDMGIDRVEIIRGPASVLYGSDALGGVINIIDEKPAALNSNEKDATIKLFSNTLGLSFNYGAKKSMENRWRKFRIGFDNHADYSDGNSNRVLNSRFASYNVKMSWGRNRDNRTHVSNLMASSGLFGFVFDSLSRKERDGRFSRTFDGPHHSVSFIKANTENTYSKNSKKIKFNAGIISNLRLEDEGGGGISLSMLLNTVNALGQITRPVGKFGEWTYGSSLMIQTNTNFGGRIIIPNAWNGEFSGFSFYQATKGKFLLEGGIRYDRKFIETFATRTLNIVGNESPTQSVLPFMKWYNAFNFSLGTAFHATQEFTLKANASTGYRPGNLAELSSNGLHEGSLRWEIGLPDAKTERNVNLEFSAHYHTKSVRASASMYRNQFQNFFYLAPTGKEYFGFFIYQFEQTNASLQGGELQWEWSIPNSRFESNTSYSFISAKKSDGSYLPFIPANRVMSELRFRSEVKNGKNILLRAGVTYTFDQNHPAEFETRTARYLLIHAGLSAEINKIRYSLTCNNLLNENYYDHLSRFKYYGIGNMGRNIVLTINF